MIIDIVYIILLSILVFALIFAAYQMIRYTRLKYKNTPETKGITIHTDQLVIGENGLPKAINKTIVVENENPENRVESQRHENEKRKHPRQKIKAMVDFVINGRLFKENAIDYSRSGIFLKSFHPDQYQKDQFLTLTFQMINDRPRKHWGKIVRTNDNGFGVKFVNI